MSIHDVGIEEISTLEFTLRTLTVINLPYWRIWRYSQENSVLVLAGLDEDEEIVAFAIFRGVVNIRLGWYCINIMEFTLGNPSVDGQHLEVLLRQAQSVDSILCKSVTYCSIEPGSEWLSWNK